MNRGCYSYREAADTSELRALLRIRYRVYRRGQLAGFVSPNQYELDLDRYDCRARHFGLFFGTEPVGYMRLIQKEETHWAGVVREIASCSSALIEKVSVMPEVPFPVMTYFSGAKDIVTKVLAEGQKNGEPVCEAGRFSILPEHRGSKLGANVVECSMAIFTYVLGFRTCLITCAPKHHRLYSAFCFHRVEGTEIEKIELSPHSIDRILMLCQEKELSLELKTRIKTLANRYRQMNEIRCYLPVAVKSKRAVPAVV